jgi:hypothetical protein
VSVQLINPSDSGTADLTQPSVIEFEMGRLAELEITIKNGLKTFVDVGNALIEIRDARLYRGTHPTFEAYCKGRWDISRPYAYQLIDSAATVNNLSAMADIPLPTSERVVRPLTKLEPALQREVWREAVATAPKGVTAKHVQEVVSKIVKLVPMVHKPAPTPTNIIKTLITKRITPGTEACAETIEMFNAFLTHNHADAISNKERFIGDTPNFLGDTERTLMYARDEVRENVTSGFVAILERYDGVNRKAAVQVMQELINKEVEREILENDPIKLAA